MSYAFLFIIKHFLQFQRIFSLYFSFSCRLERNLARWKNPRRTPDRDRMTLKYEAWLLSSFPVFFLNANCHFVHTLHVSVEND